MPGRISSVRTAKIDASAAAAASTVAVAAPSRAHWLRIRNRVRPISRWITEVSVGCAMAPQRLRPAV